MVYRSRNRYISSPENAHFLKEKIKNVNYAEIISLIGFIFDI